MINEPYPPPSAAGVLWVKAHDGTRLYTVRHGCQKSADTLPSSSVVVAPPTLVLCDGIGCAGYIWRHLIPVLTQYFTVVTWHYRGHGLSDLPYKSQSVTIKDLCDDLHRVLAAQAAHPAILVGHSMGAQLILEFALRNTNKVHSLIALCGTFGEPLRTLHHTGRLSLLFPLLRTFMLGFPQIGQRLWRRVLSSARVVDYALNRETNWHKVRRQDFLPYFEHLKMMNAQVFVRMLDDLRQHNVEQQLPKLNLPVLIIAGELDQLTPAWLSRRMHRLLPQAELLVVASATHVAPIEYPELVVKRMVAFITQHMAS